MVSVSHRSMLSVWNFQGKCAGSWWSFLQYVGSSPHPELSLTQPGRVSKSCPEVFLRPSKASGPHAQISVRAGERGVAAMIYTLSYLHRTQRRPCISKSLNESNGSLRTPDSGQPGPCPGHTTQMKRWKTRIC